MALVTGGIFAIRSWSKAGNRAVLNSFLRLASAWEGREEKPDSSSLSYGKSAAGAANFTSAGRIAGRLVQRMIYSLRYEKPDRLRLLTS